MCHNGYIFHSVNLGLVEFYTFKYFCLPYMFDWRSFGTAATLWSSMPEATRAMVVSPVELTQACRLESTQCVVGRVVQCESTDTMFACYLLGGFTRKHLLYVEAWREVATAAAKLFKDGEIVRVSHANVVFRKNDKMKWSLSGSRFMIRFDKQLKADPVQKHDKIILPGYAEKYVVDIPLAVPTTTLQAAACLREGTLSIRVMILEIVQRPNLESPEKSLCKAIIQDQQQNVVYQAELVGWGSEAESEISKLETDQVYDICPVMVSPPAGKASFSLRWFKGTKAQHIVGASIPAFGAVADAGSKVQLSAWKDGGERRDYSKGAAVQVAVSTVAHLLPEKGVQQASSNEVWELPFVTILQVSKNAEDAWGYTGCSTCGKKCTRGHASNMLQP